MAVVANTAAVLAAIDARDPAVASHSRRVAAYAVGLAAQYGLSADALETIRVGALLHDIGKLLVPTRILGKPGRLTEREWEKLKGHPETGLTLIERMGFGEAVGEIVLYHHERMDGSGYPDRLSGEAISWAVRIVSVMDAFDALTSPRAYREALSIDAARALLAREAGSRYCPWVVSGLLSLPRPLLESVNSGKAGRYIPDGVPGPAALGATHAWTAAHAAHYAEQGISY